MKSVLITGTNRGVGLGLTQRYLLEGYQVYACCRHPESATDLQKLIPAFSHLTLIELDVSQPDQIEHLKTILEEKPIDLLINNAGVLGTNESASGLVGQHETTFGGIEANAWLEVLKVNTVAPLLIAQALFRNLQQGNQKTIVNISSIMGSISENEMGGYYVYRSSKAALNAITKSMAIDFKPYDIIAAAIHPGWVKTDMGGQHAHITVEESVEGITNVIRNLSLKDSGSLINYEGKIIAW